MVHISGHNGGTGASPLSSIKHAGMPWELGLADTQRALVDNGLRSRVRVRVDGGFMTGRQVIVAALMGADEYSFGTAAMIAEGCIMLRACHRDTCKPGVATQRPHLRANFTGHARGRGHLLPVRRRGGAAATWPRSACARIDEAIGRVELLRQRTTGDDRVDVDRPVRRCCRRRPTRRAAPVRRAGRAAGPARPSSATGCSPTRSGPIWDGDDIDLAYEIRNADRSIGAALSGAIALEYGELPPRGTARVRLTGTAGQSFGAFLTHGIELELHGRGQRLRRQGHGRRAGRHPPAGRRRLRHCPVLAGNTCLYGATGGELFVAGGVGERFAVRNSGATAVVEGAGDHCCEYMTGGTVVVLGPVG